MHRLEKTYRFNAAHNIPDLPAWHPCSRVHGHNYEVTLILEASELDKFGFITDVRNLDNFRDFLDSTCDHRDLNAVFGDGNTSSERLAEIFFDVAASYCRQWLVAVRVRETPTIVAEFRGRRGSPGRPPKLRLPEAAAG